MISRFYGIRKLREAGDHGGKRRVFVHVVFVTGAERPDLPPWLFRNCVTCAERLILHTWLEVHHLPVYLNCCSNVRQS